MLFMRKTTALPSAAEALPGRAAAIPTATTHFVNGERLKPPYPAGLEQAVFGLGCFWGAERKFWELGDGVHVTAVGYAGGYTPNPSYEEVCSAKPRRPRRRPIKKRFPPKASVRSRPRSRRPASSISPRIIISNIWPRTRPVIAGSVAPACPARSAPASARDGNARWTWVQAAHGPSPTG